MIFLFAFTAPALFLAHAVLQGSALAVTALLGIKHGFGFSAGLLDFVLNFGLSTKGWLIIPVGLVYFVLYYVVFRFLIVKLNLKTPGREDEEVGFIAFHLNAARENMKVNYVVQEVRIYKKLLMIFEEDFDLVLDSVKCSDLFLLIKTFVKKETLPLQFLIRDMATDTYTKNPRQDTMLQKCVEYIEESNNLTLTKKQRLILSAFIENIDKEGDTNG